MHSEKKMLFILHLPPPVHGAAMVGQWIKDSAKINGSVEADYINLSTSQNLQAIGKGGLSKLKALVNIQVKVIKALLNKKYDLCYMTLTAKGAGFYKDVLIVCILKIFRKKIVYHFHNKGVKKSGESFINKLLYRFVFRKTNSILLSPHLYKDISGFVDRENVFFCPNGITDVNYTFSEKQKTSEQQPCKFLFLSNMMEEKGVIVLLEACKKLKDKGFNFECHFIGAWSDITEAVFHKKINHLNISSHVFAHGKRYGDEKLSFFEEADAFIFPTFYHNECFPLVLLEAMQAKLPVISTFEGGIPDIVVDGETGILTEKRNGKTLAETLALLIDNPEMRLKMGLAGRKRYEELFTLKKFEANLISILEAILKKQR